MNPWHDFEPERITKENFISVIEIPKGGKKKYELDKESGMLILDRVLFTSTHYPTNYGFIPRTLSEDGDPLDVLVLCQEHLDIMTTVECYPIGVLKMIDNNEVDEKIIAIPFGDPTLNFYSDVTELPEHLFLEIKHFFEVYKHLENKETFVEEVSGRLDAETMILNGIKRYIEKFGRP
ncbi:MAG: inorganic diphosphatase [Firmicutes bacterium]|nr:inorganic diphosphatase [Bacillota bacterium]